MTTTPGGVRVLRDIPFAQYPGFRPVSLDLYLPDAAAPAPVILQLHGGGWRVGSRSAFSPLASQAQSFDRIVAAGFAVVAADYRLSGEAVFPAQVTDVEKAFEWIAEHAAEHGIDPSRIVIWGGSAGGTLAALVGLQSRPGIRGVIDWYGPSDLAGMSEHSKGRDEPGASREDLWIGGYVPEHPDTAGAASPVTHVHAGAPSFLIAHGLDDTDVPPSQSEALAAALAAVGVDVQLHLEPGAGHFWKGLPDSSHLFDAAIAFAARVTS